MLVSALLLSEATQGGQFFRCRFDQVLRRSCCCGSEDEGSTPPVSIIKTDCCDRHSVSVEKPAFDAPRTMLQAPLALPVSPAVTLALGDPPLSRVATFNLPRLRERIVLLNCALLV